MLLSNTHHTSQVTYDGSAQADKYQPLTQDNANNPSQAPHEVSLRQDQGQSFFEANY